MEKRAHATNRKLLTAAQALLSYAKEMEQIALSDAIVFLESENKQLQVALEHEPHLAAAYTALQALFDARASVIADGIARANEKALMMKTLKERPAGAPAAADSDR